MNPTDVSNAVNAVINAYPSGSRIGFSGVEVGQCPAPVCEYMVRLGMPIPSMANDRADGWGTNSPAELSPYVTHEAFEPGKQYPEGTIYMWNSPHIAFSVAPSDGSNTVKVFEQNADPDGAGCQVFNRTINTASHTCTYVLIPITTGAPPPIPYTVEPIPQKTVVTTHATNRWNLGYQTFDQINANPLASVDADYQFPTVQIVHHQDGYSYYVDASYDQSIAEGINILDCVDYVAPPVPYVPPAAPVPVKLATQITLVVSVPVYANAHDADVRNVELKTGEFPAGMYYQFGSENGMLNIGLSNQAVTTVWINPQDNVAPIVPPVPETVIEPQVATSSETALDPEPATTEDSSWRSSYVPFYPSGTARITRSIIYDVKLGGTVTDFGGTGPVMELSPGAKIGIYGKFYGPDGVHYYRPRTAKDTNFDYWYGVPISFNGRAVLTLPAVSWLDRIFHKGLELKSIFTSEEVKLIDSIRLDPFKRKNK